MQIHCVRSLLQSVHRAETFICAEDCAAPAAGANGLHSPLATLQDGGAVLTRSAAHGRTMMSHPARRDTARAASFDRRATGDLTKTVEAKLGEISAGWSRPVETVEGSREAPPGGEFASLTVQEACAENGPCRCPYEWSWRRHRG